MYEPRNVAWLVLAFVVCAGLFAVQVVRRRGQTTTSSRRFAVTGSVVLWLFALLAIFAVFGIKGYDNRRMRAEIRSVAPARISRLDLRRGQFSKEITGASDISELITLLQSLKAVSPHHSHPTDEFEVRFDFMGQKYHYRIGRDSQRAAEYWVMAVGDSPSTRAGLEIGRVHSDRLGPLVEMLLKDAR